MSDIDLTTCQAVLEYDFSNLDILIQALTHSSLATTRVQSNERMEFLGDAVLDLSVCSWLYEGQGDLLEGVMTRVKSAVVSRKTCSAVADALGLSRFLRAGREIDRQQPPASVMACLLEAVIGAIYLDGGFAPADQFIRKHFATHLDEALNSEHQDDFKSLLQQYAQRELQLMPEYILLDEKGPDYSKCFEIAVSLDGKHYPGVWAMSKKEAEQGAAREALLAMEVIFESEEK